MMVVKKKFPEETLNDHAVQGNFLKTSKLFDFDVKNCHITKNRRTLLLICWHYFKMTSLVFDCIVNRFYQILMQRRNLGLSTC